MANQQNHNPVSAKAISFWLPIIATLVSLAVSWGVWTTKLAALEVSNAKQDVQIEIIGTTFTEVKVQLAEIKRDLVYIRERVDD